MKRHTIFTAGKTLSHKDIMFPQINIEFNKITIKTPSEFGDISWDIFRVIHFR